MSYSTPKDVYTAEDLIKLVGADETIRASVTVRGEYLREIVGVRKIDGSLGSADSGLESFGSLRGARGTSGSASTTSPRWSRIWASWRPWAAT